MPPPNEIKGSDPSLVCSRAEPTQSSEVLFTPAAAQQSTPAKDVNTGGIPDNTSGVSYARQAAVTRQPTSIFQSTPLQGRNKIVAMHLADALQIYINEQIDAGETVDPALQDLALTLHEGKLPNLEDPRYANIINQSFQDPRLDAIVHSIAMEADHGPNRSLHALALDYSLRYYLHQTPSSPADAAIQNSLVSALSNSNNSDSRTLLSQAGQNANPTVRAQIQQALSTSPTANREAAIANAGAAPSTNFASSPTAQAARVADTTVNAVQVVSSPSNSSLARIGSFIQAHADQIQGGALILLSASAPNTAASVSAANLIWNMLPATGSLTDSSPHAGSSFSPVHFTTSNAGNNTTHSGVSHSGVSSFDTTHPEQGSSIFNSNNILPIAEPYVSPRAVIQRSLTGLGLSDSTVQTILDSIASPFLLGCASIQGGLHHAMAVQATANTPFNNSNVNYENTYRVAAVSSRAGSDNDQEGFGEGSPEGSQGGHSEGESSGQQDQHPDEQAQNPADVYTNHLA